MPMSHKRLAASAATSADSYNTELERLLQSPEPAIRYKTTTKVLGRDSHLPDVLALRSEIARSPLVFALLSERNEHNLIPWHPYQKWRGAHWVLACLADLGYPPGDASLKPLMDQVYLWLLGSQHTRSIQTIDGRVRRCASQEGNALYASLVLGLADSRSQELAERLMSWQWPDGGWNCDKRREAVNSSFHESLIPLRALSCYGRISGDPRALAAAERVAEIFLKRELFKRQRHGEVISADFITLHYPCYWHYDFLFGLKVLVEAGFIQDERCHAALDLLESKRLPGGGFPAEKLYYKLSPKASSQRSLVDWGKARPNLMNEFVTIDALYVLKAAGRYSIS
jgi:hypothetical protein